MKLSRIPLILIILVCSCAKLKTESEPHQIETPTPTHTDAFESNTYFIVPTQKYSQKKLTIEEHFEPAPTEIKTSNAILKLGKTQFSEIKYSYNPITLNIEISGLLKIYSDKDDTLSAEKFELSGIQDKNEMVATLNQKNTSQEAPVIRAKVTCLTILQTNDQNTEQITCQKAIVDFFVFYKSQYFTDQFETQIQKSDVAKLPLEQIKTEPTEQPPVQILTVENEELQTEGSETSLDSRYQGQVQVTNVVEFLNSKETKTPVETEAKSEIVATAEVETEHEPAPLDFAMFDKNNSKKKLPVALTPEAKEIKLNTNFIQSAQGNLRPKNQAIGFPDSGSLRNATSLVETQKLFKLNAYFSVVSQDRERFYGTYEINQVIIKMGEFINKKYSQFKLFVGNVSAKKGGKLSPHLSHQNGTDADIAYPTKTIEELSPNGFATVVKKSSREMNKNAYSAEKTYELFKFAFKQTEYPVDRIFADRLIIQDLCNYAQQKNEFTGDDKIVVQKLFQNIEHVDGHGDHFHVRLKCSENQPACRSKLYTKTNGCSEHAK